MGLFLAFIILFCSVLDQPDVEQLVTTQQVFMQLGTVLITYPISDVSFQGTIVFSASNGRLRELKKY